MVKEELATIRNIVTKLESFDQRSRRRIIDYVCSWSVEKDREDEVVYQKKQLNDMELNKSISQSGFASEFEMNEQFEG